MTEGNWGLGRGVINFKIRRLLSVGLAATLFFGSACGWAIQLPPGRVVRERTNALPIDSPNSPLPPEPTLVLGTVVKDQTVDQVARDVLQVDPTATVFVDEGNKEPVNKSVAGNDNAEIKLQKADTLNSILIYMQFGWETGVYLVSSRFSWLQTASLFLFDTVYTSQMDLKLGRWTRLMQIVERPIAKGLKVTKISPSKVQKISRFLAHGALVYVVYGLMQVLSDLPSWHMGFVGVAAQLNILRKGGFGFLSSAGWTMLERKWDPLNEKDRPISRQAFTVFDSVRSMITGIFIPFLISTGNSVGAGQFALHNLPFLISGAMGTVFYFWGDRILSRYPQIGASLERFQKLTERINNRLTVARNKAIQKLQRSRRCSAILAGRKRS